jgi:hypothetical protein
VHAQRLGRNDRHRYELQRLGRRRQAGQQQDDGHEEGVEGDGSGEAGRLGTAAGPPAPPGEDVVDLGAQTVISRGSWTVPSPDGR